MNKEGQSPGSGSDRAIERGEIYDHAEYGPVEVTGIWQQTQQLDTVSNADEHDLIVVRYVPEDGTWMDELAKPLDEFYDAIESAD